MTGCNASPQPAFCNLVDTQHFARLEIGFDASEGQFQLHRSKLLEPEPGPGRGENLAGVLRECQLTPKDKVILAYTIAQAYHHFYDSDLMRIKWTSEAIWFMPPVHGKDEIPLRPYLSFPFGTHSDPVEDFIDNARLVHQHPRILAIGILLLEVGLSKPFRSIPQRNTIAQVNCDHLIAHNWLSDLKKLKWDGFTHKSLFDKAVEYCIREGKLLVDTQSRLYPVGAATGPPSTAPPDDKQGILKRRQKFYKNVVLPLKWLAETGFRHDIGNKLYIRKSSKADSLNEHVLNQISQQEASFHSGKSVNPTMWLRDLNSIGVLVERQRRAHRVKTPIRVAILDTGIFEMDNNAPWRIKNKRDFVDEPAMMDTFGHGTLMARLVMECAPSAEITVARVARNTEELKVSQENIEDAILWAGIECQADIISMSFGFPKDHEGIDKAIKEVQSQRKEAVLFLASAGNSSSEDENFPARHSSVISIYAANCRGTFLETNPRLRDGASAVWGIYGSDIPDIYYTDIHEKHPNVCQPGSSIATAVAAGIGATMIAYADLLPYLESSIIANDGPSRLGLLRRKSGMEALFKSMVKGTGDGRQWFVDPISFWRDTTGQDPNKHFERYSRIYSCLQEVSLKL
ncbi:s8 family peptidase [Trichoderma arundinaceum]|uniref:S8 family peptidase n=1 Tax=Trichoderma arundinaceum TaxID=490622 RepID=A0A395NWU6_TRIAR|nr:s8 family peptidase [Trichoderma arundinaceum]